jgi:hypothetical protein
VPGRAAVTQVALKDGHTSTMRYDLTTKRSADGGHLEVRFERFQFVEFDGKLLRAPELHAVREELEKMASLIPTLLVSPEGEFTGVEGLDEMIDALLAWQRGQKKRDPATTAKVEAFMRSPEMKAAMTQKTGDYWQVWVGLWLDLHLVPGEKKTTSLSMGSFAGGASSPATFEHHGPVPGEPGLVRLSMRSLLEGEQAKAAVSGVLQEMQRQLRLPEMPRILRMRRDTQASTDIDPLTARPRRVRMEVTWDGEIEGHGALSKREMNEYEFDWSPAASAGP